MKIDWKSRFKNNPIFKVQLVLSVFVPVLAYYGISAEQLTTWKSVYDLVVNAISNPYVLGTIGVSVWNTINNPTTKSLGDKDKN